MGLSAGTVLTVIWAQWVPPECDPVVLVLSPPATLGYIDLQKSIVRWGWDWFMILVFFSRVLCKHLVLLTVMFNLYILNLFACRIPKSFFNRPWCFNLKETSGGWDHWGLRWLPFLVGLSKHCVTLALWPFGWPYRKPWRQQPIAIRRRVMVRIKRVRPNGFKLD